MRFMRFVRQSICALIALFIIIAPFRSAIVRADDEADVAVVFHDAAHEVAGGEIGAGGKFRGVEWREAAPEIEWIGQFVMPDFFREEDLGFDRS